MIVVLLPLLLQASEPISPPLFEIPRDYWGEYNEVVADCGTGNNDSRLRISWDRIHFYESVGEITGLLRQNDGTLVIVAEHSGEGQKWQSVYQLRLSQDRQRLTVIHPQTVEMGQYSSERTRCPTAARNKN